MSVGVINFWALVMVGAVLLLALTGANFAFGSLAAGVLADNMRRFSQTALLLTFALALALTGLMVAFATVIGEIELLKRLVDVATLAPIVQVAIGSLPLLIAGFAFAAGFNRSFGKLRKFG